MAVGTVSGITPDNWQLLETLSPSSATTSTSTVSLSGYKTLMLTWSLTCSVTDRILFYFNGDTGANYASVAYNGSANVSDTTSIETRTSNTTNLQTGNSIIYYANIAAPKIVDTIASNAVARASWFTATALSSISFKTTGNTFSGTIKIYGIAG